MYLWHHNVYSLVGLAKKACPNGSWINTDLRVSNAPQGMRHKTRLKQFQPGGRKKWQLQ
jgi:hypothetical protein